MFLVKILKRSTDRQCLSQLRVRPLSQSGAMMGIFNRGSTEETKPEESVVKLLDNQEDELEIEERQRQINFIRNKSGLQRQHRNILHGTIPYTEGPESWVHQTLKYKRKMYGQYGSRSRVDPSKLKFNCWRQYLTCLRCRNLLLDASRACRQERVRESRISTHRARDDPDEEGRSAGEKRKSWRSARRNL